MTRALDNYLSGRYQACAINYNDYLKKLFGKRYGIDEQLTYSIQFVQLTGEQLGGAKLETAIPERLRTYVANFDAGLSHDEYNSDRYSFRLLFKRKLVNRPGQADKVIAFIDPNSELAKVIDKEYWGQEGSGEAQIPCEGCGCGDSECRIQSIPNFTRTCGHVEGRGR